MNFVSLDDIYKVSTSKHSYMIELNVLFAFEGLLKYKLSKLRTEEMDKLTM